MDSDIVASVLAAAASSAAAEVVTEVVTPVSFALQEAVLQSSLANTGDVVGAVLASWADRDAPAAESSDPHEDAHEDVGGDGGDANRRPRARRRVDPFALLDVQPVSTGASGADMTAAVEKLKTEVDVLKRRAERFGTKVHKSKIKKILPRSDQRRLVEQKEAGFISGIDVTAEDERAKRELRAKKYGLQIFDFEQARAETAGLSADDLAAMAQSRERASRFGVATEADRSAAVLAADALKDDWTSDAAAASDPSLSIREHVIHVRAPGYLAASSKDVSAFFSGFGVSWVEWLNGVSLNVMFEDKYSAMRALESLSVPVPAVPDVAPVSSMWRISIVPLKKLKTDKYALAGSETTLLLRLATTRDTKEHTSKTFGAGSHGTGAWIKYCKMHGADPHKFNPYRAQWELKFAAAGTMAQQSMLSDSSLAAAGSSRQSHKRGRNGASASYDAVDAADEGALLESLTEGGFVMPHWGASSIPAAVAPPQDSADVDVATSADDAVSPPASGLEMGTSTEDVLAEVDQLLGL